MKNKINVFYFDLQKYSKKYIKIALKHKVSIVQTDLLFFYCKLFICTVRSAKERGKLDGLVSSIWYYSASTGTENGLCFSSSSFPFSVQCGSSGRSKKPYIAFASLQNLYAEKYIDLYLTLLNNNNYTVFKTESVCFIKEVKVLSLNYNKKTNILLNAKNN